MESKKKKILYVITKSNWGGAQRYVYDLATNMPKSLYDISVALGGDGLLSQKLENAKIKVINIPHLERDFKLFNDVLVFWSLIQLFIHEKPNVIHLNSSKIGGLGALAGRIYNGIERIKKLLTTNYSLPTRIIFTAHGWAFNEPRGFFSRNLIKLLSWMTILFSHKIIAVSEKDYHQAIKMPLSKNKIFCVQNGVKMVQLIDKMEARKILLGKKFEKFEKCKWICTIAELTNNKGIEYAIKSFAKNNVRSAENTKMIYVVIGDGENKYKLANLVKQLNLTSKVFLVGYKKNASVLLRAFDIFLLPSVKEGLPYVLLEAGRTGLPTIATNVGGIPEIITDMESGILVRPKDSNEIHKALSFLTTDEKRMKKLGNSLKKHIKENFTTTKMIEETVGVYEK